MNICTYIHTHSPFPDDNFTLAIVSSGVVGFVSAAAFCLPIVLLVVVVMKRRQRSHAGGRSRF